MSRCPTCWYGGAHQGCDCDSAEHDGGDEHAEPSLRERIARLPPMTAEQERTSIARGLLPIGDEDLRLSVDDMRALIARAQAPRTFKRISIDPKHSDFDRCAHCLRLQRNHYGLPVLDRPEVPSFCCDPLPSGEAEHAEPSCRHEGAGRGTCAACGMTGGARLLEAVAVDPPIKRHELAGVLAHLAADDSDEDDLCSVGSPATIMTTAEAATLAGFVPLADFQACLALVEKLARGAYMKPEDQHTLWRLREVAGL